MHAVTTMEALNTREVGKLRNFWSRRNGTSCQALTVGG